MLRNNLINYLKIDKKRENSEERFFQNLHKFNIKYSEKYDNSFTRMFL